MIDRRTLLTGLAAIIAAPAIVRATSIMPVKPWGGRVELVTEDIYLDPSKVSLQWSTDDRNWETYELVQTNRGTMITAKPIPLGGFVRLSSSTLIRAGDGLAL